MAALSSGFFSDQARADAGSAFENALEDLRVKYERKAQEDEAKKAAEEADAAENDSDAELDALMDDPELERIRAARLKEMKAQQETRRKQLALGHGRYKEIVEEEFLPEVTKSKYVICHFYHREFLRCKIMDKHLHELAPKYHATKFVYINAEKTPFFVNKLQIKTLPTLVMFEDGVAKDKLIGFEGLGDDDFPIKRLVNRLKKKGILRKREPTKDAPEDEDSDGEDSEDDEAVLRRNLMRIAIAAEEDVAAEAAS